MATLFLICGLPGAGKTTLAKQLEQKHDALRLCPDEWIAELLDDLDDRVEMNRLRERIESIQWEMAKRVLILGTSVILENGFWSHEERMRFRSDAESLGAQVELHFLDISLNELWSRIEKRNADLPLGSFHVGYEEFETWSGWFEPPSEDEMPFLTHTQ